MMRKCVKVHNPLCHQNLARRAVEQRVTAPSAAVWPPIRPRTEAPRKVARTRFLAKRPRPSCPPTVKMGMLIITRGALGRIWVVLA